MFPADSMLRLSSLYKYYLLPLLVGVFEIVKVNFPMAGGERFELSSDSFGDYYFAVKLFSYIMYSKTQTRIQPDLVGARSFFVLIICLQL